MTFTLSTKSLREEQLNQKIDKSKDTKSPTLFAINKDEVTLELTNQTFELSPISGSINNKQIQKEIYNDINSLEGKTSLIQGDSTSGAFESMFGESLIASNPYGNGMNRYSNATDIMGMADSHSAKNRLGGADSARMNGNAPLVSSETSGNNNNSSDSSTDDYTFVLDEDGNVIGYDNDQNGDPIESTRNNMGPIENDNSDDPITGNPTGDNASSTSDKCPGTLSTIIAGVAFAAGDAGAKAFMATGHFAAGAVGAVGGALMAGAAYYFTADTIDDICENPNPMDDNYGYEPGTPLDPKIERLFTINPDRDPINEGSGESGPYTGPSLGSVGSSYGGISTGTWEENGGEYMGPSLEAVMKSMAGTSTGSDWY